MGGLGLLLAVMLNRRFSNALLYGFRLVFFLPVLVAVIVTPAAIQIMDPSVKEAATPSARR